MSNNIDRQYLELCDQILRFGINKKTRNGDVLSIFSWQIRHNMSDGFPLLTTKKMAFKTMVTELLWFLRGDTNIKYLVDNDCHIWDGDAYKRYHDTEEMDTWGVLEPLSKEQFINKIKTDSEFAKTWGELGPIYGKQWRSWTKKEFRSLNDGNFGYTYDDKPIDQIANLINELKTNPDSRRLMVSAWNVGELDKVVLPPCHYGFQMYTRELSLGERVEFYYKKYDYDEGKVGGNITKMVLDQDNIPTRAVSLMWSQRSADLFLGIPFNIASYGLLLEIIAKEVNMVPDQLIGNLGDVHLYNNHIEQAKEQISRTPYELPTIKIEDEVVWKEYDCLPSYKVSDFTLENYQSHPSIKAPLSN